MSLRVFSPLQSFGRVEKDQYKYFFVCLVKFIHEAIWSWTFVCREFLNYRFYFASSDVCSNYLFLLDSVLVGYMFLETCPFLLGCQICWHIVVHSIPLLFFVFLLYWLLCLLFIYYFVYLGSLSFLLGEPSQKFANLVYPFKEPALGFIDFFLLFFNLLFISSLIFIISFLLLTLCFVCSSFSSSFSNSFKW